MSLPSRVVSGGILASSIAWMRRAWARCCRGGHRLAGMRRTYEASLAAVAVWLLFTVLMGLVPIVTAAKLPDIVPALSRCQTPAERGDLMLLAALVSFAGTGTVIGAPKAGLLLSRLLAAGFSMLVGASSTILYAVVSSASSSVGKTLGPLLQDGCPANIGVLGDQVESLSTLLFVCATVTSCACVALAAQGK